MITLKDALNYVSIKGLKYELHGACTSALMYDREKKGYDFCEYTDKPDYKVQIGFEFKKDVWYWFQFLAFETEELSMEEPLRFAQRYNRQNGAKQTSWKKGWECELEIERTVKNLF